MKKKTVIISILLIILLIVGLFIYKNSNKDSSKDLEEKIKKNYTAFDLDLENFINTWLLYSKNVKVELSSNNIDNYVIWIKELDEYKKTLDNLYNNSKYLKESCVKDELSPSVKSLCESFINNYETSINHYVNDINEFNNFAVNNGLGIYDNKYQYVDLNQDGEFKGKE